MLDTHRDSLRHLVAAYHRERACTSADAPSHTPLPYRELFVEPLLAMLGWQMLPRHGDIALAPWPAATGLEPAYVCAYQGTRRFMVGTAPPGLDIDVHPGPARLLRRRAWSAHLPIAVLTNVETITLYDTRIRPSDNDGPHVGRLLHVPWDDIAGRWDALDSLLSKRAVASGAFDAFAFAPAKRETSVKQALTADMQRFRTLLAAPPAAAQAVLDAVIFLAMLRARGAGGEMSGAPLDAATDAPAALAQALEAATHPWDTHTLKNVRLQLPHVDTTGLRTILREVFSKPRYDFAWLPDDILGQVYEACLLPRETTGAASNAAKTGGVYYTPGPVVQHIVRHVTRRLLQSDARARWIHDDAATLRILDPACGAGAFLVEMYRALLDAALAHYLAGDPLENPRLTEAAPNIWRLSLAEKCRILKAHVFGVDIDPEAVAVTRRALLLVALSGEPENDGGGDAETTSSRRMLPDLCQNIVCGNMLIGTDFGKGDAAVSQSCREAAKPLDWRTAFPAAAAAGGFDAVVGNPPYGVSFTEAQKAYLKARFAHQGDRPDSYLFFMELCLEELTRLDGFCGLVIPNPWLTNVKQGPLRAFVLQNACIEQIVHFGCAMFKSRAVVDTQIVLMRRRPPQDNHVHTHWVRNRELCGGFDLASATALLHEQAAWCAQAHDPINIFVDETRRALAARIKAAGPPASTRLRISVGMKPYQVGKGRPKQTQEMVRERVYDALEPQGPDYRRFLRGADIRRFAVAPVRERYVRFGPWLAEPRLAANFDAPQKILLRQTSDHLVAAIDCEGRVCMNNLHVLTPISAACSLEGFMGVFNSRLMNWYYQIINPERGEALAEVKKHHVANLPVPDDAEGLARVADAAKRVTQAAQSTHAAALEHLDAAVYALFALQPEQIAIIAADAVD